MARTLEGTKAFKKTAAPAAKKDDMRSLRCPRCRQPAVPTSDGKGGVVAKCGSCGGSFSSKRI